MTARKYPCGVVRIQPHTPDKPEVLAIAAALGVERHQAFGAICHCWCWFASHTGDGVAIGVTPALLDQCLGRPGLAEAMMDVGWLVYQGGSLSIPDFDSHCESRQGARTADERRSQRLAEARSRNTTAERESKTSPDSAPGLGSQVELGRCTSRADALAMVGPRTGPIMDRQRDRVRPRDGTAGGTDNGPSPPHTPLPVTGTGKDRDLKTPVSGTGTGIDGQSLLRRVRIGDLRSTANLWNLANALAAQNPLPGLGTDERSFLLLVGAAERSLEVGDQPERMFAALVGRQQWEKISNEQEERAIRRIAEWRRQAREDVE